MKNAEVRIAAIRENQLESASVIESSFVPSRHMQSKFGIRVSRRHQYVHVGMIRVGLLSFVFCAGCLSPAHTRLPVLWDANPQMERQAFQQTDPFPDPDLGPDTHSRPPAYTRPRSESRRAAEQRLLQGLPTGPEGIPHGDPHGGLNRPAAVY